METSNQFWFVSQLRPKQYPTQKWIVCRHACCGAPHFYQDNLRWDKFWSQYQTTTTSHPLSIQSVSGEWQTTHADFGKQCKQQLQFLLLTTTKIHATRMLAVPVFIYNVVLMSCLLLVVQPTAGCFWHQHAHVSQCCYAIQTTMCSSHRMAAIQECFMTEIIHLAHAQTYTSSNGIGPMWSIRSLRCRFPLVICKLKRVICFLVPSILIQIQKRDTKEIGKPNEIRHTKCQVFRITPDMKGRKVPYRPGNKLERVAMFIIIYLYGENWPNFRPVWCTQPALRRWRQ